MPKICEILDENLKNLNFLEISKTFKIPNTFKFQRLSKFTKIKIPKHFQNFKDFFKSTACHTDEFIISLSLKMIKSLSYWAQRSIHKTKCGYFANAQYDNMDFKELSTLDERVAKLDENGAKQEKIDTFFRVVERIVRYKNEKPQKFEELFADLNALCQKRKNNAEIDEYLKEKFFD